MPRLNRRTFLAGSASGLLASRSIRAAEPLRIAVFPGYSGLGLFGDIASEVGIDIQVDTVINDENMQLQMRGPSAGKFDLVMLHDGFVQDFVALGLVQPIAPELVQASGIYTQFQAPDWAKIDDQLAGVPIAWYSTGLLSLTGSTVPNAWTDLLIMEELLPTAMIDAMAPQLLIWNRARGAADPTVIDADELKKTVDALKTFKTDRAALVTANVATATGGLAQGEAQQIVVGFDYLKWSVPSGAEPLQVSMPGPGGLTMAECICVTANVADMQTALAVINGMLASEHQVQIGNALARGVANSEAVADLNEGIRNMHQYDNLDAELSLAPIWGLPPMSATDDDSTSYSQWAAAWDAWRIA